MHLVFLSDLAQHQLLRPYFRRQILESCLLKVKLADQERIQATKAFTHKIKSQGFSDLESYRKYHVLTKAAFSLIIESESRLLSHCIENYRSAAEARFLRDINQFDSVVYSLIRVRDRDLARELFIRLDEGESSFSDLASRYSEGPEKITNGVVGPMPLAKAHPVLLTRLTASRPGFLHEPIRIDSWFLILRLERRISAVFDEKIANKISKELFEEWLDTEVEKMFNGMRPHLLRLSESG